MIFFLVISLIICTFYFVLISAFSFGWFSMPYFQKKNNAKTHKISVIIAYRNEEKHIKQLLDSILKLNYPVNSVEFIFIDDNSEDETTKIIHDFMMKNAKEKCFRIISLDNGHSGKKEALRLGINHANYDLIACTDADCILPANWLNILTNYYIQTKCKLITAPICFHSTQSFFEKAQQIEIGTLITSAGGAIQIKRPILCNGANLFFEKELYFSLQKELEKTAQIASGDDMFLLQACQKQFGAKAIGFVKSKEVCVETIALKKQKDFIFQRIRWGGKTKYYTNRFSQFVAIIVAAMSFFVCLSFILTLFKWLPFYFVCFLYAIKYLIDFPLIYSWLNFINNKKLIIHSVWVSLVYPFYISIIVIMILFLGKINWKQRIIKS